jgi:hypothetical protein
MSSCICQPLGAPLDAVAFDWSRANAVVVHNRSIMIIDLCDVPHRAEPYQYFLCSPDLPNVITGIANQWLRVVTRFDSAEQPIGKE